MDRIVRPKPSANRERKQRAEHTHCAGRRAAAAGDARKPVLAGLNSRRCRALAHAVSKPLDVCPRHRRDLQRAQQRLDVPFDATSVTDPVCSPSSPSDAESGRVPPCSSRDRSSHSSATVAALARLSLRCLPGRRPSRPRRESAEPHPAPFRASTARRACRSSPSAGGHRPSGISRRRRQRRPSGDEPQNPSPPPCPHPIQLSSARWLRSS